uniref:Calmodulin like 4 n=1 Tax=Nothoprocta perdicaria TaxID=30464 RepID=A0A8C7ED84_NOTPE
CPPKRGLDGPVSHTCASQVRLPHPATCRAPPCTPLVRAWWPSSPRRGHVPAAPAALPGRNRRALQFKECFSLYDKKQKGKIRAGDLLVVMRCLGASPTPGEVQRHLHLHRIGEQSAAPKNGEILTALSMIDRQRRGFISAAELRAKLTRLGEKLSEQEGTLLHHPCSSVGPNGTIKYEEFVRTISLPVADY